jgi:acetyl-CoA acetyltransferase
MSDLRGAAAVVGVGVSRFGELTGRGHLEIMAEAVHGALAQCALKPGDIDGVFGANIPNMMPTLNIAEYLGIHPRVMDGTNIGGASFVAHLQTAALYLREGLCEVALIAYGSNQKSGVGRMATRETVPYEALYRPRNPINSYALATARHMHQYGTTRRHLAEVAVAARRWAARNPAAVMRDALTIEDVLGARMVVDPLSVRDCCLVTDGGGAVIMTRAERAGDFPLPPVYLLGVAAATSHKAISSMLDLTVSAAADSGPRAFAMAGLAPAEVDVVELYDAFTINTIMFLEDLGFCAKGEGGPFVADGAIAPGGRLPVNTNGGGLSCVHPGMYGIFLIIEAVEQLRGGGGERQVAGAETALVHGNGGVLSSQVTALFGTAATL